MKKGFSRLQKGFTLVELLIVVIILAILAAIVVPQFGGTTEDAKLSALDTTLASMRAAIDVYYQQHSAYPGANTAVPLPADGCSGTEGAGTAADAAQQAIAFAEQLSLYTNMNGRACSKPDPGFVYGPYLKKATLPNEPFSNSNALEVVTDGDLNLPPNAANPGGWKYDTASGKFFVNDNTDNRHQR